MAVGKVDARLPRKSRAQWPVDQVTPIAVRTAHDCARHPVDRRSPDRRLIAEVMLSAGSAHAPQFRVEVIIET
jgi:hypothetical protein